MKRKSLLLVIPGVAIAIIIALAVNIHMKLSALEPEGHGDESAVVDEIITGKPSHSERTTEEGVNHNKNIETSSHSE